jgi:hypothetical protein
MAMRAEARAWWADLEEAQMRERIERRRAAERARNRGHRRRPRARPAERIGGHPDRIAAWAAVLGFVLVLVAIASGHG